MDSVELFLEQIKRGPEGNDYTKPSLSSSITTTHRARFMLVVAMNSWI